MLVDLAPGVGDSNPSQFFPCWDILYFVANGKLMASKNGTPEGVIDMGISSDGLSLAPGAAACFNGRLMFAYGGSAGMEPWYVTPWPQPGAPPVPRRLADLNPGAGSSSPASFVACGTSVFFTATNGVAGQELWRWDGDADVPPAMVTDLRPGATGAGISNTLVCAGDAVLYFGADDGATGLEPWRMGVSSTAQPELAGELVAGSAGSYPSAFTALGNDVFFTATVSERTELYVIRGGVMGPGAAPTLFVRLGSAQVAGYPRALTVAGGKLWFVANHEGNGERAHVTDGTPAGTRTLYSASVATSPASNVEKFLAHPSGSVIFYGTDASNTAHIYFSDGTVAGTYAAETSNGVRLGRDFQLLGARLLLSGTTDAAGREPFIAFAAVAIGGGGGPLLPGPLLPN